MRNRTPLFSRLLGAVCLLALGWALAQTNPFAQAQPPAPTTKTPAAPELDRNIVAYVNNVAITRQELGEELIARKGANQLKLLINRKIIEQAAQRANLTVTEAEIEADLKDFMAAAGCSSAREFEKSVLMKRETNLYEYKEDVIKPAILMRKLGGQRVAATDDDLKKAFDSKYGERVQCYVIVEKEKKNADALYHEILSAAASGEKNAITQAFLRKARIQADKTLAANAGLIHVTHNSTYPTMERRAFEMRDNDMSEVIQTTEGFVILLRDKHLAAKTDKKFENEKEALRKEFAEAKLRIEVPKLFKELRDKAVVQDFLNNKYDIKTIMEQMGSVSPAK